MDYAAAKFWFEVFILIVNGALFLYVRSVNRNKVTADKIEEIKKDHSEDVKEINKQLAEMDKRLAQAIGHAQLEPIWEEIKGVGNKLSEINGKMHTLDLIQEFLMNKGGSSR